MSSQLASPLHGAPASALLELDQLAAEQLDRGRVLTRQPLYPVRQQMDAPAAAVGMELVVKQPRLPAHLDGAQVGQAREVAAQPHEEPVGQFAEDEGRFLHTPSLAGTFLRITRKDRESVSAYLGEGEGRAGAGPWVVR